MKKIYLFTLALLWLAAAKAQQFQHLYGNNYADFLTDGNNAYCGGATGHFMVGQGGFGPTFNATRTDMDGHIGGPVTFNNSYYLTYIVNPPALPAFMSVDKVRSVELSDGSGFAVSGSYNSTGGIGMFYTTLDPNGNPTFAIGYNQNRPGITYSYVGVQEIIESKMNMGELYITGYYTVAATNNNRAFVFKITQGGTILWGASYELTGNMNTDSDIPYDIVESTNLNATCNCYEVLVVGEHTDNTVATPKPDGFVLRLNDATGAPTQIDFYGNKNSSDVFTSVLQSSNANIDVFGTGYAIGGYTDIQGSNDMWMMALRNSGAVVWDHLFDYNSTGGFLADDYCNDIIERVNNNSQQEYYLTGYTTIGNIQSDDIMVIKADVNGNGVGGGQFTYGDLDADRGVRADFFNGYGPDADGLAVYSYAFYLPPNTLGGFDDLLVKAYFNGFTACNQDLRDPIQDNGKAKRIPVPTGEFWPNTFYDYDFLVGLDVLLQDAEVCWSATQTDGSNARIARPEPKADKEATVSPNPMAQGTQTAVVEVESNSSTEVQVAIYDMLGRQYYSGSHMLAKGNNKLPVDISNVNMAAGMYTITLSGTDINKNILLLVK